MRRVITVFTIILFNRVGESILNIEKLNFPEYCQFSGELKHKKLFISEIILFYSLFQRGFNIFFFSKNHQFISKLQFSKIDES